MSILISHIALIITTISSMHYLCSHQLLCDKTLRHQLSVLTLIFPLCTLQQLIPSFLLLLELVFLLSFCCFLCRKPQSFSELVSSSSIYCFLCKNLQTSSELVFSLLFCCFLLHEVFLCFIIHQHHSIISFVNLVQNLFFCFNYL